MQVGNDKNIEIRKAIIRAVAFYDLFDFPLSPYEIYAKLGVKAGPKDVLEALDGSELGRCLGKLNGLYFLAGRESIWRVRQERYVIARRKYKTALRAALLFSRLPWIEMIAIGNIIGANNAKDNSDIDFFIIARSGKIWLTRFFCSLAAKILGWRPHGENTRDKICLSFFITEEAMDLEPLMLKGRDGGMDSKDDPYFAYWIANLTVIFAKPGVINKFVGANGWIKGILPNWPGPARGHSRAVKLKSCRQGAGRIMDQCLSPFSAALKKMQLKIMPAAIKNLANRDTRVVVNDNVLKLHVADRREAIREEYSSKLINLI